MEEGSGADLGAQACGGRCDVGLQWEEPEERRCDVGVQWEEPEERRCDVGVQWEEPEERRCDVGVQWEEPEERRCDVGVQSDTQWCDVAVQVDLVGLSCRTPGSGDVPWSCVALRPEQTEGGALWHCCVHGNGLLAPPPSAALLCPSPSRTPDATLQTTVPSMHPSSPELQSSVRSPSMPSCGDSPSSHHQGAGPGGAGPQSAALGPEGAEPQSAAPGPEGAEPQSAAPGPEGAEPLAPDGFMAPLSSDEDAPQRRDEKSSDAVIKKRRRRPKNSASLSDPETTPTQKRRNKTGRAAGLPLRYLDYDLESCDQLPANKQQGESGEGAGPGMKQENTPKIDKKVLFLPYYKQSLNLKELAEFQNMARQQCKTLQEEDHWPNGASVVTHAALEPLKPRPLSPGTVLDLNVAEKPRLLPLKLKKLKNNAKSRPPASKKTPDWSIENAAIKEELTGDESGASESPDWYKAKIKRIKVKKELELSKFKKVVVKQEDGSDGQADVDYSNSIKLKDENLGTKRNKNKEKRENSDVATTGSDENNDALIHVKRRRGRPKKRAENPEEIKQEDAALQEDGGTTLTEPLDRPRRATVRPPVRYSPETEELCAWRQETLKLGDVLNGDADAAGMVKKVKILNGDADDAERRARRESSERATEIKYEYEDIEDIYVLREDEYTPGHGQPQWAKSRDDLRIIETDHVRGGAYDDDEQGQWEWRKGGNGADGEWVSVEQRRRVRRKRRRENLVTDLSRKVVSKFLVFRDEETSAVTLIPPCAVKLHKLTNRETDMIV
ncbi:uncharacterized protein LOC110166937 [Boleophthalmus pectinirostris]|uniref:uncharacterized protein LOC110166937 n=1 Tax=Boleophthalmus pectinirostris TaxID=150288 RepID=UPI00242F8A7E|nr:uncharacterized protein LOC110166937 [Boleophthalmus pectinirostris]